VASCRGPLGRARPLSIAALDAAISESIGRDVRRDRLARDDRVYRWIVRRAIAEGSLRFKTTYAEGAAGAGYDVPRLNSRPNRRRARECRVSTIYRALMSLQGAGLVRFAGHKRENGQWRCLEVELVRYDGAPVGRSRRRPTRCPGGRVFFGRRSGTSPAVVLADQKLEPRVLSARARGTPKKQRGEESREAIRRLIFESMATAELAPGPVSWPNERFDVSDQEMVEVVEEFERSFGCKAQFSFRRNPQHGDRLRSLMHRLERYRCPGSPKAGYLLRRFLQVAGGTYEPGHVQSLAYFLPAFEDLARLRRRKWRLQEAPKFGIKTGEVSAAGIPTWL